MAVAIALILNGLLFTVVGISQAFAPETWVNRLIPSRLELVVDQTKWKRTMTGPTARFAGCLIGLFGLYVTVQSSILLCHFLPTSR
ncbi:hypothetical protein [Terriglobus sp. ADX1]|uniref:hypothetical protein n=1 Tax=Terriglobus sp. ADX1 TaxID=2794063 RepID=UPI002FE6A424